MQVGAVSMEQTSPTQSKAAMPPSHREYSLGYRMQKKAPLLPFGAVFLGIFRSVTVFGGAASQRIKSSLRAVTAFVLCRAARVGEAS